MRSTSFVSPKVTSEMNNCLSRRYTKDEVHAALLQMGPMKSSGPEDFGESFYQKYWHIIGEDISRVVLHILHGAGIIPSFNSTIITLIPKKCNTLYSVIYKLVSKVIRNRFKPLMNSIISSSKSAFIPKRIITDNIFITHELLHSMKNNVKGWTSKMSIKFDMSKAYKWVE